MNSPHNTDRYDMQETPESADERECIRQAAYERMIDHADRIHDEMRDRQMEERMEASMRKGEP